MLSRKSALVALAQVFSEGCRCYVESQHSALAQASVCVRVITHARNHILTHIDVIACAHGALCAGYENKG